jgi:hypothetical protein
MIYYTVALLLVYLVSLQAECCVVDSFSIASFSFRRRSCGSGGRTTNRTTLHVVTDEDLLVALERLEKLDENLGDGCGALKERVKLNTIIEQWEKQQQSVENATTTCTNATGENNNNNNNNETLEEDKSDSVEDENDDEDDKNNSNYWDVSKFVVKHSPDDRVAIFGGDPSRRRQNVEKKLAPYKSLDQYGTPRDVGHGDVSNLIRKIYANKLDVVYIWTRFNCHGSRNLIRDTCIKTGTRFEEVNSLSYIRVVVSDDEDNN